MAKDRFLAQGVTGTKRPRGGKPGRAPQRGGKPAAAAAAKSINRRAARGDGSESEDNVGDIGDLEHRYGTDSDEASSSDDDALMETAAEKRLRLAKEYIGKVKAVTEAESGDYDAAQMDRDLIAERLLTDAQERSGRWSRRIASSFVGPAEEAAAGARVLRTGHRLPVTSVAVTPDGRFVYSGSKDGSLIKWQRESGAKLKVFYGQNRAKKRQAPNHRLGHCDHILAIAVSHDSKYVATGGRDRRIHIWSVDSDTHLAVFHQHKDSVTGLAFRRGSNQLYSCSADRMVKLWNIDELGYMDTLFGHQDSATAISTLHREQAVTTGGRDKTVRLWKIADEAQLVFRAGSTTDQHRITKALTESQRDDTTADAAHLPVQGASAAAAALAHADTLRALAAAGVEFTEQCVDCVAMIDEETYVTGGDSGALSLWSMHKKKPVYIYHAAHGVRFGSGSDDGDSTPPKPHWITAVAAVPFTDLFFSASSDGWIRMWQMRPGKTPGFDPVGALPAVGFVNSLAVCELPAADPMASQLDLVLAAAVGQEPRLGRWEKVKARNVVKLFQLSPSPQNKAHT
ncbi:pre-rRNA processing protein [Coemansia nantahalensis]|uniref:Pre-rRNA processing protein n=1 Tax=Coemansia nantahalensis TaxID=2789366 RepID=A0ACC1K0K3_9FUNG|nr:pre-rRNA processing protein [Coemansia nantahalensis]